MSYPRKYPTGTGNNKTNENDWNAMVDFFDGFTPSGTFRAPYTYLISTDGVDYYASNAFQTIYGGPSDEGGVDGADGDAVIQAAINALPATGGTIAFKAGRYEIGSSLLVEDKHGVALIGEGQGLDAYGQTTGTSVIWSSADIDLIQVKGTSFKVRGTLIRDLHLIGSGKTNTKSGIYLYFLDLARIENVQSENSENGFTITSCDTASVVNCGGQHCSIGLYDNGGVHTKILGGDYSDNDGLNAPPYGGGIALYGGHTQKVKDAIIVRNGQNGISVLSSRASVIDGCTIHSCDKNGVSIWSPLAADSRDIHIANNFIFHNGRDEVVGEQNGVYIDDAVNININGNSIFDIADYIADLSVGLKQEYAVRANTANTYTKICNNHFTGNTVGILHENVNDNTIIYDHNTEE